VVPELESALTPIQDKVTQQDGTESLFSSLDKFDCGTGWPSFVDRLEAEGYGRYLPLFQQARR
jgi:peptide methionine sulfoxide reductase MsrB